MSRIRKFLLIAFTFVSAIFPFIGSAQQVPGWPDVLYCNYVNNSTSATGTIPLYPELLPDDGTQIGIGLFEYYALNNLAFAAFNADGTINSTGGFVDGINYSSDCSSDTIQELFGTGEAVTFALSSSTTNGTTTPATEDGIENEFSTGLFLMLSCFFGTVWLLRKQR